MKPRIHRVEITTHCHATEDQEKVLRALKNILPEGLREKQPIIEEYKGHYGNVIKIIRLELLGSEAQDFVKHLGSRLEDSDKSILKVSFDYRYDQRGNKFFIRLDKQAAYNNRLVVSDGDDVIKIVISLKGSRKSREVAELLGEYGVVRK